MKIMSEDEFKFSMIPTICSQKIVPFLRNRDPLSEYLSICNLGAKDRNDHYLLPQEQDPCSTRSPCNDPCKIYDFKCVDGSRIKPFRELSKEMGHRIQGRHTLTPFEFIIHDSEYYYKFVLSMITRHLYVVFSIGTYIHNFSEYKLQKVINKILETDPNFTVVLCGHSMGAALALKCAEMMATDYPVFLKERCSVIAFAPFPCLESDVLLEFKNIQVYFTAIQINGHIYVDPWFYKYKYDRKHYPFTVLLWNETVRQLVPTNFEPVNEMQNEMMDNYFTPLHAMSTYILFFSLHRVKKRKQTAGKRSKRTRKFFLHV